MIVRTQLLIPQEQLVALCHRYYVRELALFGSVLRDDFRSESDIDVLVEFEPSHAPGLIRLAGIELELSDLLGGRRVDLNTPLCLKPLFP